VTTHRLVCRGFRVLDQGTRLHARITRQVNLATSGGIHIEAQFVESCEFDPLP
jgi:hypothetical protein